MKQASLTGSHSFHAANLLATLIPSNVHVSPRPSSLPETAGELMRGVFCRVRQNRTRSFLNKSPFEFALARDLRPRRVFVTQETYSRPREQSARSSTFRHFIGPLPSVTVSNLHSTPRAPSTSHWATRTRQTCRGSLTESNRPARLNRSDSPRLEPACC